MFSNADNMRVIADRYLRLAEQTTDTQERVKFLDYASVFMELAERRASESHERQEISEPTRSSDTASQEERGRPEVGARTKVDPPHQFANAISSSADDYRRNKTCLASRSSSVCSPCSSWSTWCGRCGVGEWAPMSAKSSRQLGSEIFHLL